MNVFHVKYDDMILVHQRYMLFRFQVAEAEPAEVHLDLYVPCYFEEDGRPGLVDNIRRFTVEIGEPFVFEQEGQEGMQVEEGEAEITVAAVDGEDVTVYVTVPDGWGAVKEDDVMTGENDAESDI